MSKLRIALAVIFFVAWAAMASGQTTTTTATVTDTDGTAWANAGYTINIVSPIPPVTSPGNNHFTTTFTGTLNSSGQLSVTLQAVLNIYPANTTWKFCLTPTVTGPQTFCTTVPVGNTGQGSEDISTQLNAAILAPRISGGSLASGYADAEVPAVGGSMYFNVTSNTFRCYTTSWGACGSGGSPVTWPASGSIVVSNATNAPAGLAPVNGDCVVGAGGAWTAGSCAGAAVSITSPNSTLNLSPSPLTGTGTVDINLANPNSWSAAQTFSVGITVPSTTAGQGITLGTNDSVQHLSAGVLAFGAGGTQGLFLASGGKDLRILDSGDYAWTSAANVGADTTMTRPAAGAVAIGTFYNNNGTMDFQQWNATPVTITTGATPAISTASLQTITLSANATPTVTIASGEELTIEICQPATGGPWTWTWPAAMHGGMTIGTNASACSLQSFVSYNGTTLVATNTGVTNVAP